VTWFARLYVWATYRLYYEFAWAYDLASWLVSLGRWAGWRRGALDFLTGQRVLEVGFGTGELLVEMAVRGLAAVGLDLSTPMHRAAARKLARHGQRVPRVRAVVQAMPFADGRFDSIVSTFPAGYILEAASLREIARLLRAPDPASGVAGGRLIVVGLVIESERRLWRWAMRFLFGTREDAVLDRFGQLARRAGLRVTVIDPGGRGLRVPVVLAERNLPTAAEGAPDDGQAPVTEGPTAP
jgi:ubiquinone/menaquinone biosynthesis C-methylase UbiE